MFYERDMKLKKKKIKSKVKQLFQDIKEQLNEIIVKEADFFLVNYYSYITHVLSS